MRIVYSFYFFIAPRSVMLFAGCDIPNVKCQNPNDKSNPNDSMSNDATACFELWILTLI